MFHSWIILISQENLRCMTNFYVFQNHCTWFLKFSCSRIMEIQKDLILGVTDYKIRRSPLFLEINDDKLITNYSRKDNIRGRLLLALGQYLQHTNKFDKIFVYVTNQAPFMFYNGTFGGTFGKVNRSEVDIDITPQHCNEVTMEAVDFSYPFMINDYTFVTFKPEYKPRVFGIFQTFSLNVWITLASVLFAVMVISHFILKYKCNYDKIALHVFAILMKQNAVIIPSSFAENLLVYSWVIGAMILCLSHDSVFLSFLSFPPLTKIKHLSDLAVAVQKGDYNCVAFHSSGFVQYLKNRHLEIIAENISKNDLTSFTLFNNFFRGNKTMKIAYFTQTDFLELFAGKFFVSEDRFLQTISSISVRRRFCCKELLDSFVHRMMASGIYFKYWSDFIFSRSSSVTIMENETTRRKLTLTDLAPAFIFLMCGYFISLLVLFWEIISSRRNRRVIKAFKKRRIRKMFR